MTSSRRHSISVTRICSTSIPNWSRRSPSPSIVPPQLSRRPARPKCVSSRSNVTRPPPRPRRSLPAAAPATGPATQATATTQRPRRQQPTTAPATQPVPAGKYVFLSGGQGNAEEGQVDDLLKSLHPLHVEKYVEPGSFKGGDIYLDSPYRAGESRRCGRRFRHHFDGPGHASGRQLQGRQFRSRRALIDKVTGDFKTKKPAPPPTPPPGHPPFGAGGFPSGQ